MIECASALKYFGTRLYAPFQWATMRVIDTDTSIASLSANARCCSLFQHKKHSAADDEPFFSVYSGSAC